jgi:hypothetical protein
MSTVANIGNIADVCYWRLAGILSALFLLLDQSRQSQIFALMAMPALAQEPVGCDKFKWPLDRKRALLANAAPASSGGNAQQLLGAAA